MTGDCDKTTLPKFLSKAGSNKKAAPKKRPKKRKK